MEQHGLFNEQLVLERLVSLRKQAGLTQKMVESRLGWRKGTLYDYEKGRLKISLEACWQLLKLYGGNWDALFNPPRVADESMLSPLVNPLLQLGMISPPMLKLVQKMRQDPIIIAEIGLENMQTTIPVLHLLLDRLTETQGREFFLELCRYVNSMIAADQRMSSEEKKTRDILLAYSPITFDEPERMSILRAFENQYYGKGIDRKFPKEALKHLLIWVLFIMALSDGDLNHSETSYIKAVAENIELKASSFNYIRDQVN